MPGQRKVRDERATVREMREVKAAEAKWQRHRV
jgi:hypothetical protein